MIKLNERFLRYTGSNENIKHTTVFFSKNLVPFCKIHWPLTSSSFHQNLNLVIFTSLTHRGLSLMKDSWDIAMKIWGVQLIFSVEI